MSRETIPELDHVYTQSSNGVIPIKWYAPECILARTFTSKSDVWSYGVTLWEIFSYGGEPYSGKNPYNLIAMITQGFRMESPPNCSPEIYFMMNECWQETPEDRPSFSNLALKFFKFKYISDKDHLKRYNRKCEIL
jgi:serine/threonine protein kinase